jgi:hypothetical protein
LPKRGNTDAEFEDAWRANLDERRFAVADGATESIGSDVWAKLLVEKLVHAPAPSDQDWHAWLSPLRAAWWCDVSMAPPKAAVTDVPEWLVEDKLAGGAAAAFVRIELLESGRWEALGVGDSCLFHLRGDELLASFPLSTSAEFNNRPHLVRTSTSEAEATLQRAEGRWQSGDRFLLMTDALAQWFLVEAEQRGPPRELVQKLIDAAEDSSRLEAEISSLRESHVLRNDDVVLLMVEA